MALTHSFGFTNGTDTQNKVTLQDLDIASGKYALTTDEPDICKLSNVTAPIDQPEVVSFGCQDVGSVNSSIRNLYPPKVKAGVQYTVKLEELLRTTDSEDATYRVDDPIVATLTVRHTKSSNISSANVDTVIRRLVSCLFKADGTSRVADLMRSSLKPTVD